MTKNKRAESQNNTPWNFEDVCSKIDNIANKLAKEIIRHEPQDLLHRAFWSRMFMNLQGLGDSYSERDRYLSGQVLEFVQNYLESIRKLGIRAHSPEDKSAGKVNES